MELFFISPPIAVIFFGKAADNNTHKNAHVKLHFKNNLNQAQTRETNYF
jgi:hypothetical protein